jgi:hypothetical protein
MNDPSRRDWWQLVEQQLDAVATGDRDGSAVEDPWDDGSAAPALTDAQRALLAGIDDQPHVPRATEPHHTPDDQPPVPRLAGHRDSKVEGDDGGDRTGNIPGDSP